MKYILSQEELEALGPVKETNKWKEAAMELAKRLSAAVGRGPERGIGGKGCILENGAESEYCYGCPAEPWCPSEDKSWPK